MERYLSFVPKIKTDNTNNKKYYFIYIDKKILMINDNDSIKIPTEEHIDFIKNELQNVHYIGSYNDIDCYTALYNKEIKNKNIKTLSLREFASLYNQELFSIAGMASQILDWDINHKFCGKCGHETIILENERARKCEKCGLINYPRISPAIIVAVIKDNKILLAHNKTFKNNMYSVLAGFLESGETLENCVKREVFEEVGIKIKNIKYFGSQPWPFPNSIMLGFFAKYDSGDINVDGEEIEHANWYDIDNLPDEIPTNISISRQLIDHFINSQKR